MGKGRAQVVSQQDWQAWEHVTLTSRAVGSASMAQLEPLVNQDHHMGPAGSRRLPGQQAGPGCSTWKPRPGLRGLLGLGEAERQSLSWHHEVVVKQTLVPLLRALREPGSYPCYSQ